MPIVVVGNANPLWEQIPSPPKTRPPYMTWMWVKPQKQGMTHNRNKKKGKLIMELVFYLYICGSVKIRSYLFIFAVPDCLTKSSPQKIFFLYLFSKLLLIMTF